MFCKNCGKKIADDSIFCQHCGGKIDISAQEDVVITPKSTPLQVEVSNNKKVISSIIANEIIRNLKMVGLALVCWCIFMIGFSVIHLKDIKEHPESSWGKSCYDGSIMIGNYDDVDYKEILATFLRFRNNERNGLLFDGQPYLDGLPIVNYFDMSDEELVEYAKQVAKQQTEENKEAYSQRVNERRQSGFKADAEKKAKYSAIILLAFFIIGRYFIKLRKWIYLNNTIVR